MGKKNEETINADRMVSEEKSCAEHKVREDNKNGKKTSVKRQYISSEGKLEEIEKAQTFIPSLSCEQKSGGKSAGKSTKKEKKTKMETDRRTVEKRLANIKNIYLKVDNMIDSIPEEIPESVRNLIKEKILGDKDLKELMEGIDNHRPPRFLLVGRTGAGKSSLINAITETYTAQVSDTKSCTPGIETCEVKDNSGNILMELLDTRGIAESDPIKVSINAESELLKDISRFSPDAAIFLLSCTHRDSVGDDADFCRKIVEYYQEINHTRLPIVVVANKADGVRPGDRITDPRKYPEKKINNIEEIVRSYKEVLDNHEVKYEYAIAVSSLIEWMTPEGKEVDADEINNMSDDEKDSLQISLDGRYQIDDLVDILVDVIEDFQAKMGLRMAMRLRVLVNRLSKGFTRIFAGISATVGASPIPVSDIYILLPLQILLVMIIASLSGREISFDVAKEFVVSVLGVGSFGFILRLAAQQVVKFANLFAPALGSAASGGIAAFGTSKMGNAARKYYIEGQSKEMVREIYLKTKDVGNKEWKTKEKLSPSDIKEIDREIEEAFS